MNFNISEIPERELVKGITGKYIHTKLTTTGFVDIKKGAILPAHSHVHEQTTQVTEGKLEMVIDGETIILEPILKDIFEHNIFKYLIFSKFTKSFIRKRLYPSRF